MFIKHFWGGRLTKVGASKLVLKRRESLRRGHVRRKRRAGRNQHRNQQLGARGRFELDCPRPVAVFAGRMRFSSKPVSPLTAIAVLLAVFMTSPMTATAGDLRIVTYNIDADTGGTVGQAGGPDAGPGLTPVLEALGAIHLGDGVAQPVDVFAFEELNYSNPQVSSTLQYIVGQLNSYYGAGTYAYNTYVDPTDGNSTGNGPSGLIYNTHTVTVLSETSLAYSSSGARGRRCATIWSPPATVRRRSISTSATRSRATPSPT